MNHTQDLSGWFFYLSEAQQLKILGAVHQVHQKRLGEESPRVSGTVTGAAIADSIELVDHEITKVLDAIAARLSDPKAVKRNLDIMRLERALDPEEVDASEVIAIYPPDSMG